MKKCFEIADLIVALVKGEISREDLVILDEWIEASEENRVLFISFMDESVFAKIKQEQNTEKSDVIFGQIKRRKQQLKHKRIIRYAAGAAASVLIVLGVLFGITNRQEPQYAESEQEGIRTGQHMAYLTLASGEKVVLQNTQKDTITTSGIQQIIVDHANVTIAEVETDSVPREEYHTMEVPRGAEYSLTLPDGTRVWLNADSKLRFPSHFSPGRRYVELTGEAYFQVVKDISRPFMVHSNDVDVVVLGTEFAMRSYANRPALTTLVRGSVEVSDRDGWKAVLKPGQQAVIDGVASKVREVETLYYTAWKDGYFIFEATPLEEIMEELSLWYNCHYFFENRSAGELLITARLKKYSEIDDILDILSKTNEILMEKKGNTIMIRRK